MTSILDELNARKYTNVFSVENALEEIRSIEAPLARSLELIHAKPDVMAENRLPSDLGTAELESLRAFRSGFEKLVDNGNSHGIALDDTVSPPILRGLTPQEG